MDGDPGCMSGRFSAWRARQAGWGGPVYRGRALPGPGDLVLMSNDYLNLGNHPYLVEAQVGALRRPSNGLVMSGAFTADADAHRQLEEQLAAFMRAPATILCQSGWSANVGLIQAIAPAGSPVYIDALAHASLWAGIQAAEAATRPFPHNDLEYLERLIGQYGPGLIAFDVLYSVTGDLCPLAALVDLAERTGCRLIADESHTLGIYGPHGAGLTVGLGLTDRVAYRTASLAKTFAGRAGLVACSREMADYLPFHSLGAIFSSTLLPHDLAGLAAALALIIAADDRRARLAHNADLLRENLARIGYATEPSQSQIIPLQPGTEERICRFQSLLDRRGVFGAPFIPPSVPKDRCVQRLSVHCELTDADLGRVLDACAAAYAEAGVPDWKSTRRRLVAA